MIVPQQVRIGKESSYQEQGNFISWKILFLVRDFKAGDILNIRQIDYMFELTHGVPHDNECFPIEGNFKFEPDGYIDNCGDFILTGISVVPKINNI